MTSSSTHNNALNLTGINNTKSTKQLDYRIIKLVIKSVILKDGIKYTIAISRKITSKLYTMKSFTM